MKSVLRVTVNALVLCVMYSPNLAILFVFNCDMQQGFAYGSWNSKVQ